MQLEIINCHNNSASGIISIVIEEKIRYETINSYLYSSILGIVNGEEKVLIQFRFVEHEDLYEDDFIYIIETNLLFFRTVNQWGIIDLNNNEIIKHEDTFEPGILEKIKNSIIVDDELVVESYSLKGKLIDRKPIDPPSDRIDNDSELIYNSPCYGVQRLKIE